MNRKGIEWGFVDAGWELDGGFSNYLVVGYNGDGLSILAHKEAWQTDDEQPVFELVDHERNLTYGVEQIPTPQQAAELLKEHGIVSEEWDY